MITTKTELRKAIQRAETHAALLRQPGHTLRNIGEREQIADLLDALAQVCRRAFDPESVRALPEHAATPDDRAPTLFESVA